MIHTRTTITATPLYPGSFFPESGPPVEIPNGRQDAALRTVSDDDRWFAIEVRHSPEKRWTDGDGGVRWLPDGPARSHRIYAGTAMDADEVSKLPGDHEILLTNMRVNGWKRVVHTRAGNFQPLEPDDVVVSA